MKLYKTQISRPYKVEVYGLQDDYIGTLQSYNDSSLGRIIEPELLLSKDGTSSFTCSVPKYFISSSTNEKILNPRWEDAENGVLAENTRILKVFVQNDGAIKVYPLIIDKIEDKRDSHFAVYKDITASSLAFAELGKVGFKLELNPKLELEKDANFKPTINYWLDKVFPNVKDQNGKIIKWLTPWCYELRMDWTNYVDAEEREPNKIYEDAYVSAWNIQSGKLVPKQITPTKEKERTVDCYESNKYNITQTLAETYEVFCEYEYKCSDNGKFIGTYYDEQGQVWQGKKVIFYNQAIKLDDPFIIEYQKNLNSISRVCETDEIYTKLYVNQIPSETMTDGYITIANTEANPLRDDFILNFDYLYEKGSITEYQKEFIEQYKVSVAEYNKKLITISPKISELTATVNEYKAELALCEKTIESAEEQLLKYQKLRDNEAMKQPITKNKDNAYSVTFVKSNEITEAVIRLEGAMAATISAYTNNKYETKIFDQSNLITVVEKKIPLSGDKNYYAVLDEYGYVTSIYTSVNNIYDKNNNPTGLPKVEDIVYLELQYSPFNKYVDICNKFEKIKQSNENKKAFIQLKQSLIEVTLNQLEKQVKDIQEQKQQLNNQLETILGPALREGHWQSEEVKNYEANNSIIINQKPSDNNSNLKDVDFIFDKELFDQEETGYYYDSVESFEEGKRTYYSYIPIDSLYSSTTLIPSDWDKRNLEDLILHLYKTDFTFVSVDSTKITAGNYFIYYNSQKYYFNLEKEIKGSGTKLELNINNDTLTITRFDEDSQLGKNIPLSTEMPEGAENASNLTHIFEHLSKYLGDYKLYYNSGYTYAFAKLAGENDIVPIILLNNSDIDYEAYGETVGYTFQNVEGSGKLEITTVGETDEPYIIYYPRICISKDNVNYNSDLLKLKINNSETQTEEKVLEKYKDYSILTRSGVPYITLKINKNINIADILDPDFTLQYQISQANEQLYQDALKVAKENAYPRFSYEVEVSQLPNEIEAFQLGQLSIINDYLLGIHNARGFISEITLALDSPKDDKITIQNYKTKFEDLFSTITATSEAMKTSAPSYDIAASSFATNNSSGAATIQGSILQNSFNQNKIDLIYSDTQVQIDDKDGITLTNVKPYENGIYGKVVLRGGGIFLSHSTNDNDERIWSTGITPNGINATAITTGTLDTNLIRVFAGDNMAFQWNGEGIYAYKRDDNGIPTTDSYVQYSDKGLKYIDNEKVIVDLGWDGLLINSQDGAVSLTGKDGLIVYDGEKDEEGTNHVVKLGRFEDEENKYSYGLRLYKKDDNNNYNETLVTTNDGQLWLKDYIQVGPVQTNAEDQIDTQSCGISGVVDDNNTAKSVRFWAGSNFNNRATAPFRVLADGTLYANSAIIGGTNGSVSTEDIVNSVSAYGLKVISGNGFIYKKDSQQQTTLLTILTKGGAEINKDKLPEGANNIEVGYERSSDDQNWEPITEKIDVPTNGTLFPFTATILMDASFKYRAYCSYYLEEKRTIIYSDVINFVELTDEGTPGRGIKVITEWYAASSDKNNYPDYNFNESTGDFDNQGNWSETPPILTENEPFLWNLEVTKYTDDTSEITEPMVIGSLGEDGRSIESITNWYCLGSMEKPNGSWPPNNTYNWVDSIDGYTITEKDKYLWSYRVLHFTDGTATTTPAFAISVLDNGFNKTISNINLSYRAHNSDSTGPSYFYGSFPPTEPVLNLDNPYLWGMLTVWNSSENTATTIARSGSYLIYTLNTDKEVSSISTYYLFSDQNTGITTPDQSWASSPTGLNTSNIYNERCLWNFEQINYSDGSIQYTEPSIIGTHGEDGKPGENGRGIEIVTEWYATNDDKDNCPDYSFNQETGNFDDKGHWTDSLPALAKENPFLWNLEVTKYTDGTYEITQPIVIGTMGEDGRGIESIINWYCLGSIEEPNGGKLIWDEDTNLVGKTIPQKTYLLHYTKITYSDGSSKNTDIFSTNITNFWGKIIDRIRIRHSESTSDIEDNGPSYRNTLEEINTYLNEQYCYLHQYMQLYDTIDPSESLLFEHYYLGNIYQANKTITSMVHYFIFSNNIISNLEDINMEELGWQSSPNGLTTSNISNERCLWNLEQINYSDGSIQYTEPSIIGTHGEQGVQGDPGEPGAPSVVYRIVPSATEITRNLREPLVSPSSITFQLIKNSNGEDVQANSNEFALFSFKPSIYFEAAASGEENTDVVIPLDDYTKEDINSSSWTITNFLPQLWNTFQPKQVNVNLTNRSSSLIVQTLSIPIVPSEEITELAQIQDNKVIIAEGKVYANSIAAYQITAGKIAAGAIQTGGIAADSELILYTKGANDILVELPKYEDYLVGDITPEQAATNYASAVKDALESNYNSSTGGKMKLSSDGVEIRAVDESLIISSSGIEGSNANFTSLIVNGRELYDGASFIISDIEPDTSQRPMIWIQPIPTTSYSTATLSAYTGSDRSGSGTIITQETKTWTSYNNGREELIFKGPSLADSGSITYTIKFEMYTIDKVSTGSSTIEVSLYEEGNENSPFVTFSQDIQVTKAWQHIFFEQSQESNVNAFNLGTESSKTIYMKFRSTTNNFNSKLYINHQQYIKITGEVKSMSNNANTEKIACNMYYYR